MVAEHLAMSTPELKHYKHVDIPYSLVQKIASELNTLEEKVLLNIPRNYTFRYFIIIMVLLVVAPTILIIIPITAIVLIISGSNTIIIFASCGLTCCIFLPVRM